MLLLALYSSLTISADVILERRATLLFFVVLRTYPFYPGLDVFYISLVVYTYMSGE